MEQMDAAQLVADLFKALGHPTRVKILDILRQGEICACEMAPQLNWSNPMCLSTWLFYATKVWLLFIRMDYVWFIAWQTPKLHCFLDAAAELLTCQIKVQQSVLSQLSRDG